MNAGETALSMASPQEDWSARFVRPLLVWYGENARRLPWRDDADPYRVWVSEIMLQQTRVDPAIPYFERFMRRLPDVRALAEVPEEELLKLWEGLGYYSRARNLKKAARTLAGQYGGQFPRTLKELTALPGVGDYTAGAILSIAFGEAVPAVDGNVIRVLSRMALFTENTAVPAAKRSLTELAARIVPQERPGDFNQALMDLGAGICRPHGDPLCEQCPVAAGCAANAAGCALSLPVKPAKRPRRVEERTVFLVVSPRGVLLRKRPGKGLLAGMWEYPHAQGVYTREQVRGLSGGTDADISALTPARHAFTHLEWQMSGWLIRCGECEPPPGYVWARHGEFALPSAFKSFTALLGKLDI